MNTLELFSFLKRGVVCNKYILGIYPRNELPKTFIKLPSAFVLNTDNRSEPGEHWLAIYMDEYRNIEFFDPAGMHPCFYGLESYISSKGNLKTWNLKTYLKTWNLKTYLKTWNLKTYLKKRR